MYAFYYFISHPCMTMLSIIWLIVLSCSITISFVTCIKYLKMLDVGVIQEIWIRKSLENNSLISRKHGVSLVNCFRECALHSRCVSVNYFISMQLCDLNSKIKSGVTDFRHNSASVYSEKQNWKLVSIISCHMPFCVQNKTGAMH